MIRTVKEWVELYEPGADDAKSRHDRQRLLNLLEVSDAPFSRKQFDPGHVTASALIFSPDLKEVLLGKHAKLKRWLQPGGHVDAQDETVCDTARRETLEETGLDLGEGTPPLVGVDVHPIPALKGEPTHEHYDLMFAWRAATRDVRPSEETPEVEWTPLDVATGPDRLGGRFKFCIARALKCFDKV